MSIAPVIARYADRFHRAVGDDHHVASPLGAWLVLALAAPAATGAVREELTEVLGMSPEAARDTADALLANPHPAVASAAAVWRRPDVVAALQSWLAGLPPSVEVGDVPTPAAADQWAASHTLGLIDRFPVQVGQDTVLVLASALATKVDWAAPFELAPSAELGGPWSSQVAQVLRSVRQHQAYIAASAVGDVAVHTARSADGLEVTSVIADAAVPAADVLAVAHQHPLERRSLFDLPLGDGPLWTIAESPGRPGEHHTAVLPTWSAESEHGLMRPEFGFPAAAEALIQLMGPAAIEAKQKALARYTRTGFEAAAVTGMAFTAALIQEGRRREATLRFGHPFAVVARASGGDWDGVPVFSAWVTTPEEPA